jgi:hypothetical protein
MVSPEGVGGSVRALKILVVVMGVLIVAGTVTLVTLIVQRAGGVVAGGGAPAGGEPWQASLGLPEGARIAGIAATDRGLAVLVTRPGGEVVLLVDPRNGRVQGELRAR